VIGRQIQAWHKATATSHQIHKYCKSHVTACLVTRISWY